MFKLIFGLIMVVVLWVILKVLFVSDAQGGPGLWVQAWNESPVCAIVSAIGVIIFGLFLFSSGSK